MPPAKRPSTERRSTKPPRIDGRPGNADSSSAASGRFVLRLEPGLHTTLREAARAENVSLNEYCARKLSAPMGSLAPAAAAAVRRAASAFGGDLLAVVAFGSWARGEVAEGSDVDLLIVVDDRVELNRELYRRWDAEADRWEGRAIDIHVAHLPEPDRFSPSVWGEVAIDGIVLFERALVLSLRLAEVRRRIAAGEVVRRMAAGGQPYWVDLRGPRLESTRVDAPGASAG